LPHDPETNRVSTDGLLVDACLPMVGAISLIAHGWHRSRLRALWPLLPFAAAAAGDFATMIVIVINYEAYDVLEGTTNWFGAVQVIMLFCFVIQPFLAAICGAVWVARSQA
jgi:hypothetical protein